MILSQLVWHDDEELTDVFMCEIDTLEMAFKEIDRYMNANASTLVDKYHYERTSVKVLQFADNHPASNDGLIKAITMERQYKEHRGFLVRYESRPAYSSLNDAVHGCFSDRDRYVSKHRAALYDELNQYFEWRRLGREE